MATVWIFHGTGSHFSSGVFESVEKAEFWIRKHKFTGVLTEYPLNITVYDWAIEQNLFTPKTEKQSTATFIQSFSSASQNHFHYENGDRD